LKEADSGRGASGFVQVA